MPGDLLKGDLVRHSKFGVGRVEETSGFGEGQKCRVYFPGPDREAFLGRDVLEPLAAEQRAAYEMVKLAVRELRAEEFPAVEFAERWQGGEVLLQPADKELKPKVIPIDALLHKVVMVRDRLRVLEQQINGHAQLDEAEKVRLQQYITRSYGSLTTFNVLFKDKKDHFVGQKGAE